MIKPYLVFLLGGLVTLFVVSLLLINFDTPIDNSKLPTVITTIFPLTDITKQIAGTSANVVQLIPSGSSPHSFTLSPQQISSLSKADIIFAIGHGLDDSAVASAQKVKDIPITLVDKDIQLNKFINPDANDHNTSALNIDPHYWLSVPNAAIIAKTITDRLIELDPSNTTTYNDNLALYEGQLEYLERELQQAAFDAEQKSFIAIHDAWSYFADQYKLNLVAVYEPSEGKQPSIKDIQRLGQIISGNKITTFFTEPQKQSDAGARLMREEFKLDIGLLDPIGGVLEGDSYAELMQRNIQAINKTN
jgi:zinc transport system substrate-binding protein